MTTALLVRHGESEANVAGILAGHLDSTLTSDGIEQARRVGAALAGVPIRRIVSSPLSRCLATAAEIAAAHPDSGATGEISQEERIAEVRYGAWTGRSLKELATEDLWGTVQRTPSQVTFPKDPTHAYESMSEMSERAWTAWQEWDRRVSEEHGEKAIWVLVSHGDVIKALLARALGLDLDAFQSIVVDPASVSIVHRLGERTAVSGLNLRDDIYERLAATATEAEATPNAGVVGGGNA